MAAYEYNNDTQMATLGYTLAERYEFASGKDVDILEWWAKDGECVLAFQGSQHLQDFINDVAVTHVSAWGSGHFPEGVVKEFEPLVSQIDFRKVKATCTKSIMVTGHSLGGALAQLFSLLVNKKSDPLGADITADLLFTFGTMPISTDDQVNDKSANGCFDGMHFFNARHGMYALFVDVVKLRVVGGREIVPVRSGKTLLFGPQSWQHRTYTCEEDIAPAIEGRKVVGDVVLHGLNWYKAFLGCEV